MKGKFRILGHIGIGVLLVCALMLAFMPVAPVAAATAVTSVWVDFPYSDAPNACSGTSNTYIVHFKATTALERGVDSVTVTFPDGSTAMGGDGDTGGNYVFTISSTAPAASTIDFSTNYDTTDLVTGATWTDCTAAPGTTAPAPPQAPAQSIKWSVLWGVIAGATAVGVIAFLRARRKAY